ncbi:MAG: hypothetical protein V1776_03815 [Candidatus Diapherotrites archaeon]
MITKKTVNSAKPQALFGLGRNRATLLVLLLFASVLFVSFQNVSAQSVTTAVQICRPGFSWGGYSWNWNSMPLFGVTVSGSNQPILTVEGQSITNSWQGAWVSEGRISRPTTKTTVQVDVALENLPSSAASAGIWFVKDNQNALIVNKHRDITDPQYNSNVFIIERVNGSDSFKYVSPDLPSSTFDTYKIQKTLTGYNVYYNGTLVYTGTLDVSQFNKVEINGVARIGGDQIRARFRNYTEQ